MAVSRSAAGQVMLLTLSAVLLSSAVVNGAAPSKPVLEGTARIVDGDTLYIGKDKIRLYGIDAPEKTQSCTDAKGQTYSCGQASTQALQQKVGNKPLRCEVKDIDQYGRNVAACSLKAPSAGAKGEDVNAYMVQTGHATAYRAITRQYAPDEDKARIQKKGIWAGKFQKPSDYRKDQKADGATQSTQQRPQQQPRPQQPRPQPAQQLPLGPRPDQPSASSVGAGTGAKPSYAGVLTGKH